TGALVSAGAAVRTAAAGVRHDDGAVALDADAPCERVEPRTTFGSGRDGPDRAARPAAPARHPVGPGICDEEGRAAGSPVAAASAELVARHPGAQGAAPACHPDVASDPRGRESSLPPGRPGTSRPRSAPAS